MRRSVLAFITIFALFCCNHHDGSLEQNKLLAKAEEALRNNNTGEAAAMIKKGLEAAQDSADYYRFVVMEAKYYFARMQVDSFLACNDKLKDYLQRTGWKNTRLETEYEMQQGAYKAKMAGDFKTAIQHFHRAIQLIDTQSHSEDNRLICLSNLADAYKQAGQYDKSIEYFREAMLLGDSIGMSDPLDITLHIGIASAYTAMGNFDQSQEWWDRTERMKARMTPQELFHFLNNRGNDYFLQKQYKKSLAYFLKLDSLTTHTPDMQWENMFGRVNLSDVYIKLGQLDKARQLIPETEAFFSRYGLQTALFYLQTQRIEIATKENRLDEAFKMAEMSPIGEDMIPEQKLIRLKVLERLYEKAGKWQMENSITRQYYQLHDSIASDKIKMRFSTEILNYEHQRSILEKQREVETHKLTLRWMITMLVAMIIIIALLLMYMSVKRREQKLKDETMRNHIASLRMESVRNRITPHFIGNALSAEIMAQLDGRPVDLGPLVQLLHRGIQMTDTELTTLAEELKFIKFYCSIESRSLGDDFRLNINVPDTIDADRVVMPSMTIQIMVENAIKHGLKKKKRAEGAYRQIWVKASKEKQGTLIEVIDNGIGINDKKNILKHTGMLVVQQTINLLNEKNKQQMEYGLDNYQHDNGDTGCRTWIYLPDNYEYRIKKLKGK